MFSIGDAGESLKEMQEKARLRAYKAKTQASYAKARKRRK